MTSVAELLAASPAVLAPMEDVTDGPFRRACRAVGARLCVTEFVAADQMIAESRLAQRRIELAADDRPTAIQIYGADPQLLLRAAEIAAAKQPAFVDLNCGCWVPAIARRGAGSGWLRDPDAMVAMAGAIARALAPLPVTVKTRIGYDDVLADLPGLARRLEDAGVAAIALHCRIAAAGHRGAADWSHARRVREAVAIPVVVNGDIVTAADARRALAETGCAAVMIGRGAIDHPWIFREVIDGHAAPPTAAERLAFYRALVDGEVAQRGEKWGIQVTRRHLRALGDLAPAIRPRLFAARSHAETVAALHSLMLG